MTNSEKLYKFYEDNPTAPNDDVMKGLDWESWQVRKYKSRLKQRGFIAVSPEGVTCLKSFDEEPKSDVFQFKQDTYREVVDKLIEAMGNDGLSIAQLIDISREIRTILKEVV